MRSCGGGDGGANQNPTTPGPNPTPATVTVNIVGTIGNGSYVPNPVQVGTNEQVIFRNNDTVVHRIIMDNGSADFGALAPENRVVHFVRHLGLLREAGDDPPQVVD